LIQIFSQEKLRRHIQQYTRQSIEAVHLIIAWYQTAIISILLVCIKCRFWHKEDIGLRGTNVCFGGKADIDPKRTLAEKQKDCVLTDAGKPHEWPHLLLPATGLPLQCLIICLPQVRPFQLVCRELHLGLDVVSAFDKSRHRLVHCKYLLLGAKQTSRTQIPPRLIGLEINITNYIRVKHFALTLAQLRQPNIRAIALNQILLSWLARPHFAHDSLAPIRGGARRFRVCLCSADPAT
jgi:hypothetical protein